MGQAVELYGSAPHLLEQLISLHGRERASEYWINYNGISGFMIIQSLIIFRIFFWSRVVGRESTWVMEKLQVAGAT